MMQYSISTITNSQPLKDLLISVVIPTLNSEETIRTTLVSIKHQTYKNLEVIVVDGLSNDSTLNIVKEHIPAACILSRKASGIWDAINHGISHSKGDYLFSLNSDDLVSSYAIEDLVRTAHHGDFDAVWLSTYSAGGFKGFVRENRRWLGMDKVCPGHSASFFVKRSVHVELGLYDKNIRFCADHAFFHKMILTRKKISILSANRRAYGVFTQGGYSYHNSYLSKATEELRYRIPYAHCDVSDFIFCFIIYPLKVLWHIKKSAAGFFRRLLQMRRPPGIE